MEQTLSKEEIDALILNQKFHVACLNINWMADAFRDFADACSKLADCLKELNYGETYVNK